MSQSSKARQTKAEMFPPLPLADWEDTKNTLHLYLQIIGKIRLANHPRVNHWWHVPLYISSCGLTTRPIPYGYGNFTIEFNFIDHVLKITSSDGYQEGFALFDGLSVSEFYTKTFAALAKLGIDTTIKAVPYDHLSTEPFETDVRHNSYDSEFVARFWRILVAVNSIFEEFRGRFIGKSTPVHLFWHSFDLALTRFSGQLGPNTKGMRRADREAYSHEVISCGFWAGDQHVREPAFYCYAYPEPENLTSEPLRPKSAFWGSQRGSAIALLMYEEVRQAESPRSMVLDFLESAYQAGVRKAGWDLEALELKPIGQIYSS